MQNETHPAQRPAGAVAGRMAWLLPLLFVLLALAHLPLLRLPYFWDEAGYDIPAARDLLLTGALIPHSTLSNAHPPLVMAWLALAWKLFGFQPAVTRLAMLLIAAWALNGVFELADYVATRSVAIAATVCLAVYPVFFAQASLAHLDMAAAAFTIWGLFFHLRRQMGWAGLWFTLAALAKETAILAPLALLAWEVSRRLRRRGSEAGAATAPEPSEARSSSLYWLLFPLLPLTGWFAYHYARTGYIFGNPEFFRYNVAGTLNPQRILLQFCRRAWQLTGHMNLYVLTLAAALAMRFPPQHDGGVERRRIAISTQLTFAVLIGAYGVALAFIGGAVLTRYLLPVIPLVVIVCVSTIRRRMRGWIAAIALAGAALVAGWFFNPPYVFAPEDNLAYRDFVVLHQHAAAFLWQRAPTARVLSAWPASDELARPWLGYVPQPLDVVAIDDFTPQHLEAARRGASFDVALVFSTKYEPAHRLPLPGFWRRAQARFFDYHRDASPQQAAQILGGEIIYREERGGQWVALVRRPEIRNVNVRLQLSRPPASAPQHSMISASVSIRSEFLAR